MKKVYLIFFLLLGEACGNPEASFKELVVKDNLFYKDSLTVYSGYVFSEFDNGDISSKIPIKNGIPDGKWVAYGYDGEIVQSGTFKPIITGLVTLADLKQVSRINICDTNELKEHFIDIFIVCKALKKNVDKTNDKRFRDSLILLLKKRKIALDFNKINKITAVNIET
ncbi:hypothetical protein [Pedobacter sp. SYP-B3415]|uniref:hypothetical protein n=1 Tax=Pedobacter sp. SYP-B3415 TaxID=2496641 RepID=UPI00101CEB92|nr:hypothetical protein [Pedobacter sp. SYP-B3415]